MIDIAVFGAWMAAFSDRFNRPLLPATQLVYYSMLSAELSTEEFERAAALAFRDEMFWPSPQAIIAKVHPPVDVKASATETFEGVREAIVDFGWQRVNHRLVPTLPAATRRALRAIGGVRTIAMATDADLPHLARRFGEVYENAVAEGAVAALPASRDAVRLTNPAPKLLPE
jgi:hypothetical protein